MFSVLFLPFGHDTVFLFIHGGGRPLDPKQDSIMHDRELGGCALRPFGDDSAERYCRKPEARKAGVGGVVVFTHPREL